MSTVADRLRSPKEKALHLTALVVGTLLWVLIAFWVWSALRSPDPRIAGVTGVYVFYVVVIGGFVFLSGVLYRASAYGNMILLGPDQFPHLHAMVVAGSSALGLSSPPKTFLYNSNGVFNAFARRILGGQFVFLTSALVEAETDAQVNFVIGHELGHHAAGHLNPWLNFLKLPAHFVPFLMPAYSRSREYSCDRIGAHLTDDLTEARRSLQMLGCGCRRLNEAMSDNAFERQEALVPPISGFLVEISRTHPRLTRRVIALRQHTDREMNA